MSDADTAPASATSTAPEGKTPVWKNPFVIAFVLGAIALTILPVLQSFAMRAPPPIASLGEWSLLDQNGAVISNETLKGEVWIASVFFSRCATVCPPQQESLSKILKHVDDLRAPDKKPIRLVSFTVDAEYDTPEVLKRYASRFGWDGPQWSFVGGDAAALKELLVKRMFLEVGEASERPGELFDIAHTSRFVLIDQNGDVRGYWTTDDLGRGNLINAARLLWKRGPNP
jgi:protein SCO1/2